MNTVPVPSTQPRYALQLHAERFVHGQARLSYATKQLLRLQPLYLLTDVCLEDGQQIDHLWASITPYSRRRLARGDVFAFVALVVPYKRRNGSRDWSLMNVRAVTR